VNKKGKILVGLLVLAISALIPLSTQSKDASSDTVVLSKDNVVILNQPVTGQSVASVLQKAKDLDKPQSFIARMTGKKKPIYLFLNTPGGSIQAGLELIEGIHGLNRPVNTITLFAASMGFQICQNLGERLILNNGVLMSHRASGGVEGEFGGQSPSQIDSRYGFWLSRLNELDKQTVKRTNGKQTLESYQKMYATEMWRTGSQSVEQGYADRIVRVNCDSSLDGVSTHEIEFMGFHIEYDLSNCPLNTAPMNVRAQILTNKGLKKTNELLSDKVGFGYACLEEAAKNQNRVCAVDQSLTLEKAILITNDFKTDYELKSRQVIKMQIGK
jgi:ATP-dependent protease ClpP protease subunit